MKHDVQQVERRPYFPKAANLAGGVVSRLRWYRWLYSHLCAQVLFLRVPYLAREDAGIGGCEVSFSIVSRLFRSNPFWFAGVSSLYQRSGVSCATDLSNPGVGIKIILSFAMPVSWT